MKKVAILIFVITAFLSCKKENTVIISGKIIHPIDEKAGVKIIYSDKTDTFSVNPEDGAFFTKIVLNEEHFGAFQHGNIYFPLYLVPGAKINIEFNAKDFEKGIQFSGKGSEATAFIYSLDEIMKKYLGVTLLKMSVDSFVELTNNFDKNFKDKSDTFIKNYNPSTLSLERINLRQNVKLAQLYSAYITYHHNYAPEDKTPIPDSFQKFIDNIPLNEKENSKEISEYSYFLYNYNMGEIGKKMANSGLQRETVAYINKLADEIIALDVSQNIKDDLGKWYFSVFYKRPDSLRKVYIERYSDVVKNVEYINEFEKTAKAREQLKPGKIAPTFSYPDINGKMVSLESLKGKVVYIDVWATWCGPCKYEFPFQKKLEEELKGEDIVFVSISIDEGKDKMAWEKMVKEEELGGFQLFATGGKESKITTDYVIQGIPYFIIIDKEGKLVEVFATRPSDPETKEKLLNLANS